MNNSNIDKVIASIKNEARYFDMTKFSTTTIHNPVGELDDFETFKCMDHNNDVEESCGTAACIAGWANQIRMDESDKKIKNFQDLGDTDKAINWLDLDNDVAHDLFFVTHLHQNAKHGKIKTGLSAKSPINQPAVTRKQAIAVLENLKLTGKTDWTTAIGA